MAEYCSYRFATLEEPPLENMWMRRCGGEEEDASAWKAAQTTEAAFFMAGPICDGRRMQPMALLRSRI